MDADYVPAKKAIQVKSKAKLAEALSKEKPVFNPGNIDRRLMQLDNDFCSVVRFHAKTKFSVMLKNLHCLPYFE